MHGFVRGDGLGGEGSLGCRDALSTSRAGNRHTYHAIGDMLGLRSVMGDDEHGHATRFEHAQQLMDTLFGLGVQTRGRLVHDEHVRIASQHAGNGCQSLLSAGQVERGAVGKMPDMQQVQ